MMSCSTKHTIIWCQIWDHMESMCSISEGLLVQGLEINWNHRLKRSKSGKGMEWAGGDKTEMATRLRHTLPDMGIREETYTCTGSETCTMYPLTVTDVVKGPLVVLEEGVTFDLIHSGAAQSNLPAHSNKEEAETHWEASCLSENAKHSPPHPAAPPTITNMSSQKHRAQWNDCSDQTAQNGELHDRCCREPPVFSQNQDNIVSEWQKVSTRNHWWHRTFPPSKPFCIPPPQYLWVHGGRGVWQFGLATCGTFQMKQEGERAEFSDGCIKKKQKKKTRATKLSLKVISLCPEH